MVGCGGERGCRGEVVAEDVEPVGFGVAALVPVRGTDQTGHRRSGRNDPAADLHLGRRLTHDHVDRRGVPQGLGEGGRYQAPIGLDRRQLLRVHQQVGQDAGDRLVGGLPARGEQQAAEGLDVLVAHPHAVDLGGAQPRQQVVARLLAALLDDRDHVLGELHAGPLARGGHLGIAGEVAEEGDDGRVPAVEAGVVGLVQTQHVGDDIDRKAGCVIADDVRGAGAPEGVDQLTRVALDDREEVLLEVAAAEGGRHQSPPHSVFTSAELEDRLAVHRLQLPVVVVGGEFGLLVLEDAFDILVAGQDVTLHGLVPDQRRVLPHRRVDGVGVCGELGRQDVGVLRSSGHGTPRGRCLRSGARLMIFRWLKKASPGRTWATHTRPGLAGGSRAPAP
jgi:hypothetical protein